METVAGGKLLIVMIPPSPRFIKSGKSANLISRLWVWRHIILAEKSLLVEITGIDAGVGGAIIPLIGRFFARFTPTP
jgi:hypothetical protein